jgi:hypothetical protein
MPASFPTAVKAFTVKADGPGNVIAAAHVNDLQDEVTAIETGLLNGTAPVHSSNSTVANLSVTGNSTIGGSLQVTGNSTITGTLTLGGALTFGGPVTVNGQPRCRLFHGSTQTSTNAEENVLTFNGEDYDPSSLHSTAVTPTRITVASTGVWLFSAVCHFAATTGSAYLRFRKNGATAVGSAAGFAGAGSIEQRISHTVTEQMSTVGDYMEVLVFHQDGFSAQTGNASSRVDMNEFAAVKLW